MKRVVIDTNVLVVANGQASSIKQSCSDAAVEFLIDAERNGTIVLDLGGEIVEEYTRSVDRRRPLGVGALFLIHIYRHQYDATKAKQIEIILSNTGDYSEFPSDERLAGFDRSDRKFAIAALKEDIPVTTAVDSDWVDYHHPLTDNGIRLNFLCGHVVHQWFEQC